MAAPTINITETIGLTNVTTAEATTNFAGFRHSGGGTPSPGSETNVFVQGNQAISIKVSGSTRDEGIYFDVGTASGSVDMTVAADSHVFIWAAMTDMAQLDAIASGGFYIIIGSSTSNWNKYYVNGSDTIDGRFVRYVLDVNKTPSETAATAATLTAVTHIGIGVKSASITGKAENLVLDRIDYGTGLQIEDGDSTTPASWQALFDDDDSSSNKYGVIEQRAGVFFLKAGLQIGDSSGTKTTLWSDDGGCTVMFEDPQYYNGTSLVSSVSSLLYKINMVGNGTGTTDISFGSVVGTGDDRQGLLGGAIGSAGPKFSIDGETDIADLDTVNLYGMTISGAGLTKLSGSTKTDVIGCTFIGCDEVQPNDAEFLNNTIVAPVPNRGVEKISTSNVKQVNFIAGSAADTTADRVYQHDASGPSFVDETDDFNSATAADVTPFPATEAVGDYFAIGHKAVFAGVDINTSTARSGGTLVWEYWSGLVWSSLTTTADGTNTLSTTGLQSVTWDPPTGAGAWDLTSLNGEQPLFYVRLRVTATMTTNPIITQGLIVDRTEHHVNMPTATTYSFTGLTFFGFAPDGAPKWMGEASANFGAYTLNLSAGSNITEAETHITESATVTTVNAVTVAVNTKDAATGAVVAVARVLVRAAAGGDLPHNASVTITRVTTVATVAHTGHPYAVDDKIEILGAVETEYNGVRTITAVLTNSYDYTVSGSPDTPATGTIVSTAVILDGDTTAGLIEDATFNYTNDQPVDGWARRSTSSPLYKTALISGTIEQDIGFSTNTFMVGDES